MRLGLFMIVLLLVSSCVPPSDVTDLSVNVDLSNEVHQTILNAKDTRDVDIILSYMSSEDLSERYLAVEACASIIDERLHSPLTSVLNADPSTEMRTIAAYALGQQNDLAVEDALIRSFQSQDTVDYNTAVRGAILEAIGKCGTEKTLNLISTVTSYTSENNHLLLGQARAIYRYGLRGIFADSGTRVMIDNILDRSKPAKTRALAAQYLNRNPNVELGDQATRLAATFQSETDVNVKMSLAGALTRTGDPALLPTILPMLTDETDYRIKSNILRQLGSFDYVLYKDTVMTLLEDENDQVFELSSALLKEEAPRQESATFLSIARSTSLKKRKPQLFSIALNVLPSRFVNTRNAISNEIKASLEATTEPAIQSRYMEALALDPVNLPTIIEKGFGSSDLLVRTTAINSVETLMTNKRTKQIYVRPSAMSAFRNAIIIEFSKLLESGDSGSIAAIASLLRKDECGFKEVTGFNFTLRSAMRKLEQPIHYEAYKECMQTLEYLEDTTYTIDPVAYNHPIDWTQLTALNDSSRAYIITTKGQIEINLYHHHAPGSVSNFVALSESNFYDGKTIHRVVPNFVIQGGCPRGDGFGSLDYTIRSELGRAYYDDAGYIGMASAGADTEGTQWFITHSPTPHLDGRYTIFGKVTAGMDVVHDIEVGDVIQDVRILKY